MRVRTVVDVIRGYQAVQPDRTAVWFEGRATSWAELHHRSSQVASALRAAGVTAGDRIAVIDKNRDVFFELLFGAAKVGAVLAGVNWRLAPAETAAIVADAEAKVLLVGPEFADAVASVQDDLPEGIVLLDLDGVRWTAYETWRDAHEAEDPGHQPAESDVVLQLYTSGTTGLPKGVMLTNRNLTVMRNEGEGHWGLHPEGNALAAMPFFHIGGAGWGFAALASGCAVTVLAEVDPAAILRSMTEHRITRAFLVPAVLQMLLATPGVEEADLSSLETIYYGASPITDTVLARCVEVFGCGFAQLYGLTETTGAVVQLDEVDHDPVHRPELLRSCGKAYPWVEIKAVADPEGTALPAGEVGELWIRSPLVMAGYWNRPDATAEAVTPDGWFRSGDVGFVDADGYVFLKDRLKDMIVSGAENVYPIEVENALAKHPAVADVAVIGVPDDRWGEAVKAIVVLRPGVEATAAELIDFSRQHIAGFKVPKSIDFVDELPRNPSGKLLKRELRAPFWEGTGRAIN